MPVTDPLVSPPPDADPWARVGRVRVSAEVRFAEVLAVPDRVAGFQESIRDAYPRLEASAGEDGRTWRFSDRAGAWAVLLGSRRLRLDTAQFAGREDFARRFVDLLEALARHVRPALVHRVGVRAVDRLVADDPGLLKAVVRDDLVGLRGPLPAAALRMSITQNQYELPEEGGWLSSRWGLLPAGAALDADVLGPLSRPSFVVDLEAFATDEEEFVVGRVGGRVEALIGRLQAVSEAIAAAAFQSNVIGDASTGGSILLRSPEPSYAGAEGDRDSNGGASLVRDGSTRAVDAAGAASVDRGDSGRPFPSGRPPCLNALAELRLTAGLTFDQAARLLGVSRRAVYQWVTRQRMSRPNEERLMRTLIVLREADRGDSQRTRAALFEAAPDGRVPFDLLAEGRLAEARELLGEGPGRTWPTYLPLSVEEQEMREPLPPWILMDARQDMAHEEVGRARGVRTRRTRRGRGTKRD